MLYEHKFNVTRGDLERNAPKDTDWVQWLDDHGPLPQEMRVPVFATAAQWKALGVEVDTEGRVLIYGDSKTGAVTRAVDRLVARRYFDTPKDFIPKVWLQDISDVQLLYDEELAKLELEQEERARKDEEHKARTKANEEAYQGRQLALATLAGEWIEAKGSSRLKRLWQAEIACDNVLAEEWIAAEYPGWEYGGGKGFEPSNVEEDVLDFMDEVQKQYPTATLQYSGNEFYMTAEVQRPGTPYASQIMKRMDKGNNEEEE